MTERSLGQTGEAVAAKYYISRGYLLLEHNYRTRMGELDLILYKEGTLVIAEVKTRSDTRWSAPAEAVDLHKQRRILAATRYYLQKSPYADDVIRFDVVEVMPCGTGWQVHCIPNAFTC
ncbi:MAG: YraN family protein [Gemmiger sp.]